MTLTIFNSIGCELASYEVTKQTMADILASLASTLEAGDTIKLKEDR